MIQQLPCSHDYVIWVGGLGRHDDKIFHKLSFHFAKDTKLVNDRWRHCTFEYSCDVDVHCLHDVHGLFANYHSPLHCFHGLWKPSGSDFTTSSAISSPIGTASTTFMHLSATFLFAIFTRSDDWSVSGCACVLNSRVTRLRSAVSSSLLCIPSSLCLVVTPVVTSSSGQGSNMMSNVWLTCWHKGNERTLHATCSADMVIPTRPPFDVPYRMYVCSPNWSADTAFHTPSWCRQTKAPAIRSALASSGRQEISCRYQLIWRA